MIGMMLGPWGALAGAVLSIGTNILSGILDNNKLTQKEIEENKNAIKQATQEVSQKLSEYDEAKRNKNEFGSLYKEVNQITGENISLSQEEYSTYQSYLKQIADNVAGIWVSEDKNGNKILKNADGIQDTLAAYEEYLKALEDNTKIEATKKIDEKDFDKKIREVS